MRQGLEAAQKKDFAKAESHYEKALVAAKKFVGNDDRLPETMYNLAVIYLHENRNAEAGEIFKTLLTMRQKKFGSESIETTPSMRNLAVHYAMNKNNAEAEALFKHALKIWEHAPGANSLNIRISLQNLASFYTLNRQFNKAEPLLARLSAMNSGRTVVQQEMTDLLKRQADKYIAAKEYLSAEPLLERWLATQHSRGNDARHCNALLVVAKYYADRHKIKQAESLLEKAVDRANQAYLGADALPVTLFRAASIYQDCGNLAMTDSLSKRAERLQEDYAVVKQRLARSSDLANLPNAAHGANTSAFDSLRFGKYSYDLPAKKNN